MTWLANDHVGNPDNWSSGLGQGIMIFSFFGGLALLVWAAGKYLP